MVHYRDPLEAIKALLGDPALAKHIVYKLKCIFTDATKEKRVYNEMWTSSWWEEMQGSCVAPVIIAMDKTQLTQFSGGQQAYPVYLTLGNIPCAIQCKPSMQACMLIAYLPVEKFVGHNLSKAVQSVRTHRVFHKSMRLLLEPLIKAGLEGIEIVGGDRHVHKVHPILACYIADYLEQCLCLQKQSVLAHASTASFRVFQLKTIVTPFWVRFPLCCIHSHVTTNYLIAWCMELINESELDCQLQTLPQCSGIHHFKDGWSKLSQQMVKVLLGCLVGKVPNDVLTCYKALLDFVYLAQYPSHDDNTLEYMEAALTLFHKHKEVFISLGIQDHFNVLKFHSLLHYHLHIDLAKEGWHASNTRNLIPQMMRWLDRQEKIATFRRYIDHPLEEHFKTPHNLKHFLNSLLPPRQAITCAQLQHVDLGLGLDVLDIWHSYKLQMDELGNDVDAQEGTETIKAKPGDGSRFETIMIVHSTTAESTGLQGVSI
ncbi:hypothetical protein EDC04DRAFT_2871165 [Pisolithus marmoratus]|nr:hypothetical protein EDC04DRAFT_2871165 [Pisolithus marmoratus]